MSQSSDSDLNLRRSSRIATTTSTPTKNAGPGPITRRRSSASQEPTVPAKLTRTKRLSLSQETSNERPGTPKVTSRSARSESKSPTFEKEAKKTPGPTRGRRVASVKIIEEDEVSSPATVTSRRRSLRSQSKSPTNNKPDPKPRGRRPSVTLEPIEEKDAPAKKAKKPAARTRSNSNSSEVSELSEAGKSLVVDLVRLDVKRVTRNSLRAASTSPTKEEEEEDDVNVKKKVQELNPIAETSFLDEEEEKPEEKKESDKGENWERDSTRRLSRSPQKKEDLITNNSPIMDKSSTTSNEKHKVGRLSLKKIASPRMTPEDEPSQSNKEKESSLQKSNSKNENNESDKSVDSFDEEELLRDDSIVEKYIPTSSSSAKKQSKDKTDTSLNEVNTTSIKEGRSQGLSSTNEVESDSSLNENKSVEGDLKTEKRHSQCTSLPKKLDKEETDSSFNQEKSISDDLKVQKRNSSRLSSSKNLVKEEEDSSSDANKSMEELKMEKRNSLRVSSGKLSHKEKTNNSLSEENSGKDKSEKRSSLQLPSEKNQEQDKENKSSKDEDSNSKDVKNKRRISLRSSLGLKKDEEKKEETGDNDAKPEKRTSLRLSRTKNNDENLDSSKNEDKLINEKTNNSLNEKENTKKRISLPLYSENNQDMEESNNSKGDRRKSLKLLKSLNKSLNNEDVSKDQDEESNDELVIEEVEESAVKDPKDANAPHNSRTYDSGDEECNIDTTLHFIQSPTSSGEDKDKLEGENLEALKSSRNLQPPERESDSLNQPKRKSNSFSGEVSNDSSLLHKRKLSVTLSSIENIKDLPMKPQEDMLVEHEQKSNLSSIKTLNKKLTPLKTKEYEIASGSDGSFQLNMSIPTSTISQDSCDEKEAINTSNNSDKENFPNKLDKSPLKLSGVDKTSTPRLVNKKNESFCEPMEVDCEFEENELEENKQASFNIGSKSFQKEEEDEEETCSSPVKKIKPVKEMVDLCDSFVDELNNEDSAEENEEKKDKVKKLIQKECAEEGEMDEREAKDVQLENKTEDEHLLKKSGNDLENKSHHELFENKSNDKQLETKSEDENLKNKSEDEQEEEKAKVVTDKKQADGKQKPSSSKTSPKKRECDSSNFCKLMYDEELDSKLDELIKESLSNYNSEDEEDNLETNEFVNDQAEEGEEDTPSEDSNNIIDEGESIHSSEDDIDDLDEEYDNSFIDDENEECIDLLSGDEYDLDDKQKERKSRIIKIDDSSDEEVFLDVDKASESQNKEKPSNKTPSKKLDKKSIQKLSKMDDNISKVTTSSQSNKEINSLEKSYEKKSKEKGKTPKTKKKFAEFNTETENVNSYNKEISVKPVTPKNKIKVIQQIKIIPSDSPKQNPKLLINNEDNLTSLEDIKSSHLEPKNTNQNDKPEDTSLTTPYNTPSLNTSRRKTSINIQENLDLSELTPGEITEKISKAVGFFCSSIKDKSGNISLNVSLDFADEDPDNKKAVGVKSKEESEDTCKEAANDNISFVEEKIKKTGKDKKIRKDKTTKQTDEKPIVENIENKKCSPKRKYEEIISSDNRFYEIYKKSKQSSSEVNQFDCGDNSQTKQINSPETDVTEEKTKVKKRNKKSKNKQKKIMEVCKEYLSKAKLEIQDQFKVLDVEQEPKEELITKKRKATKYPVKSPEKKPKTIEYFPTNVLEEIEHTPSTSEITPNKDKKSKKTVKNQIKPSIPVNDGWEVEDVSELKPSKKNKISKSKPADTLAQFIAKDFKNRMIFDPSRNKRMETAKIIKNKKR